MAIEITDDELTKAEEGIDWPLFRIGLGDDAANFFQRLLQAYKEQKEEMKVWQAGIVDKSLTIAFLSQQLTQKAKVIEMMKEALARDTPYDITRDKADSCLSEVKKMEGK